MEKKKLNHDQIEQLQEMADLLQRNRVGILTLSEHDRFDSLLDIACLQEMVNEFKAMRMLISELQVLLRTGELITLREGGGVAGDGRRRMSQYVKEWGRYEEAGQ